MTYGLLGHPLGHSLSPRLHQLLAGARGEEIDYRLFDWSPEDLKRRLPELSALGGFNITIPYKQALAGRFCRLSTEAERCGAVNTVRLTEDGMEGYNTDCVGFMRSVSALAPAARSALVIGAGGAGRMCAAELAARGVSVTIGARPSSQEKANKIAEEFSKRFGAEVRAVPMGLLDRGAGGPFDLLVNASPCGMYPHPQERPAGEELLARCAAVLDLIYNPSKTLLLQTAERMGIPAMSGLRMLVWQAAAAQEIWFHYSFAEETVRLAEQELSGTSGG